MQNKVGKLMEGSYLKGKLEGYDIAKEIYTTYYLDIMLIALHEKLGLKPEEVKKFFNDFGDIYEEINNEAERDAEDREYVREGILDRRLKESVPEDYFVPFEKRYKYDLTSHYDYKLNKWVYRYKNFD